MIQVEVPYGEACPNKNIKVQYDVCKGCGRYKSLSKTFVTCHLNNQTSQMTQEAKLQLAKKWYNDQSTTEEEKSRLEELLPELKESEDGRIRKSLIGHLKECWNNTRSEVMIGEYAKWISWLENQAEKFQYWNPSEEQLKALDYAYNLCPDTERGNYYEGVLETLIDDLHKLSEKQGEQKPVPNWMPKFLDELRSKKNYFDWDETKEMEGHILAIIQWMNPNYFNEKDQDFNKHIQDGDEIVTNENGERVNISQLNRVAKPRGWIEDYWQHHKVNNPDSYDSGDEMQFDHDGFVRFCRTYCKKSDWSEEDKKKIDLLVAILEVNHPNGYFKVNPINTANMEGMSTKELTDWLKCLRDRMEGE